MTIHFPAALTEEEEALKKTFACLKRKKKMLAALKAGVLNQEKEATLNKAATKQAPPNTAMPKDKARATEQAKKLVQSGAIKLASAKEKSGFKRSKNFTERKLDPEVKGPGVGFQPFMAYGSGEEDAPAAKRVKGLSESFVSAGFTNRSSYDRPDTDKSNTDEKTDKEDKRDHERERERDREREFRERERDYRDREPPKKGNTIFVKGIGVTEELMRKTFNSFGKIINVAMETERNKAFITFEKTDSADQAINQVNDSMVSNTHLRVSMARHQPSVETLSDASSSASWASIAASSSQKAASSTSHKDRRTAVTYDQDDIF